MFEVGRFLTEWVANGAFPGAAYALGGPNSFVTGAIGNLSYQAGSPRVTDRTVFDLASLTKVIATTHVAHQLSSRDVIDLDYPIATFLPSFQGPQREQISVRMLLKHRSGLPAYRRFDLEHESAQEMWRAILTTPCERAPGEQSVYSCIGFLVLQRVLEVAGERPLDELFQCVLSECSIEGELAFLQAHPSSLGLRDIAPTEAEAGGVALQGVVHDEVARALGGVAGNAGLFGSIGGVAAYARWMLQQVLLDTNGESWVGWTSRQSSNSTHALGWDTKSPEGSSAGGRFGPRSFGHTGFTGTSIWIDPEAELFGVLLTNRVHPSRENLAIREVRPAFHDLVFDLATPNQFR